MISFGRDRCVLGELETKRCTGHVATETYRAYGRKKLSGITGVMRITVVNSVLTILRFLFAFFRDFECNGDNEMVRRW